MSKIVFLDLDGVVVPFGNFADLDIAILRKQPDVEQMVRATVKTPAIWLSSLAIKADAKFVLISSWRGVLSPATIQSYLEGLELFEHFHPDWCAEMRGIPPLPVKGRDIGMWLGDHRDVRQSDCLVLDDEDHGLKESWGFHALAHIRPDPKVGFDMGNLAKALTHFMPDKAGSSDFCAAP